METICFCNRKGGSCKTTSAMAFADALALLGKKVLFIDMDSQFGATATYNVINNVAPEDRCSLYDVVVGGIDINRAIIHVEKSYFTDKRVDFKGIPSDILNKIHAENTDERFRYGIDIIPGDVKVGEKMKSELKFNIENQLLIALSNLPKNSYDYIILDTIPGEDVILYNALVAADDIIVTLSLDEEALSGMRKIQNILESFEKNKMGTFKIGKVLITNVDLITSKKENNVQLEELLNFCKERNIYVLSHVVRKHPHIVELKSDHCTLFNKKYVETKILSDGSFTIDEDLTIEKIYGIKRKNYIVNTRGKAQTKKIIDYTTVAKDYLNCVKEYLGKEK